MYGKIRNIFTCCEKDRSVTIDSNRTNANVDQFKEDRERSLMCCMMKGLKSKYSFKTHHI